MIAYDKHNVNEFKTRGDRGCYICSNCGQITTLSDSISCQGYHLICNRCDYKLRRLLGVDNIITLIHDSGESTQAICETISMKGEYT